MPLNKITQQYLLYLQHHPKQSEQIANQVDKKINNSLAKENM